RTRHSRARPTTSTADSSSCRACSRQTGCGAASPRAQMGVDCPCPARSLAIRWRTVPMAGRKLHGSALALVALGALALAGPALADTIHASPDGTKTTLPCPADDPCRLDYAMAVAASGDDVALDPGDYYETGTTGWPGLPAVKNGVTVHGTPGPQLPV